MCVLKICKRKEKIVKELEKVRRTPPRTPKGDAKLREGKDDENKGEKKIFSRYKTSEYHEVTAQ